MIAAFEEVKREVKEGQTPSRTVRELLSWFGAQRRGAIVVENIDAELENANLYTDPDYTTVWIDAPVTFRELKAAAATSDATPAAALEA